MEHFEPKSPDPLIKKDADATLAKFGHLNNIVDKLNEADGHQAITANPGGGQALATALILGLNVVTTATLGDSVLLPSLTDICKCNGGCGPVFPVIIKNLGPGSLSVYPYPGESIDGNGINVPITVASGATVSLQDITCSSWRSYGNALLVPPGTILSVLGCRVTEPTPGNIVILPILHDATLTGDGCTTPLSVVPPAPVGVGYTMFYGLTAGTGNGGPTDYAATVAVKTSVGTGRVPFPRNGPTSGIATNGGTVFTIPTAGTYEVSFVTSVTEPGQLQLEVNGADLPETVASRATGTDQIIGNSIITVPAGALLAVVNPAGNATALTITPASGSLTHAVAQTLTIKKLA